MNISEDIKYIGVNDHKIDLFEGLYHVDNGMSYNSYMILDEKIAILDTVDGEFGEEWLEKIQKQLGSKAPDYLIVQHMEPDHSANVFTLLAEYPLVTLVASEKAFRMLGNYYSRDCSFAKMIVKEGDVLSLGKHKLTFIEAPMVHWPEVIMTYDNTEKVLFSADGFGKFGALDVEQPWLDEARRYYFGIVGKYGVFVLKLLEKVKKMDVRKICPLHGPVLDKDISYHIEKYRTWAGYMPEEEGICIAYTSVYGNTKKAVALLESKLREKGCTAVKVMDLSRCDKTVAVAEAFRYSKLVLATTTYNASLFPPMREFISSLTERNYANRLIAVIGNSSWSPIAARLIKESFEKSKGIRFTDVTIEICSAIKEEEMAQVEALADELCRESR